jgi:hypothetical protein
VQVRARGDLTRCSTPSAAGGSKPRAAARNEHQARISRYLQMARHRQPGGSAALRSASGTASDAMYLWELDEPAEREFADLSHAARRHLAELMDAAAIIDPAKHERRAGELAGALRTLLSTRTVRDSSPFCSTRPTISSSSRSSGSATDIRVRLDLARVLLVGLAGHMSTEFGLISA